MRVAPVVVPGDRGRCGRRGRLVPGGGLLLVEQHRAREPDERRPVREGVVDAPGQGGTAVDEGDDVDRPQRARPVQVLAEAVGHERREGGPVQWPAGSLDDVGGQVDRLGRDPYGVLGWTTEAVAELGRHLEARGDPLPDRRGIHRSRPQDHHVAGVADHGGALESEDLAVLLAERDGAAGGHR